MAGSVKRGVWEVGLVEKNGFESGVGAKAMSGLSWNGNGSENDQ